MTWNIRHPSPPSRHLPHTVPPQHRKTVSAHTGPPGQPNLSHHPHSPAMRRPRRGSRTVRHSPSLPYRNTNKPPAVGDIVEVFWDGEDAYFRGKLARRDSDNPFKFFVRYDDGDKEHINLDDEHWRYADIDGKVSFKPGELRQLWGEAASAIRGVSNATKVVSRSSPATKTKVLPTEEANFAGCETPTETSLVTPGGSRASSATTEWNEPVNMLPIKVRFKRGMANVASSSVETSSSWMGIARAGMHISAVSRRSGSQKHNTAASSNAVEVPAAHPPPRRVTRAAERRSGVSSATGTQGKNPKEAPGNDRGATPMSLARYSGGNPGAPIKAVRVLRSGKTLTPFKRPRAPKAEVQPSRIHSGRIEVKSSTAQRDIENKPRRPAAFPSICEMESQPCLNRTLRSSLKAAKRDLGED